jgi:hypothetical protein
MSNVELILFLSGYRYLPAETAKRIYEHVKECTVCSEHIERLSQRQEDLTDPVPLDAEVEQSHLPHETENRPDAEAILDNILSKIISRIEESKPEQVLNQWTKYVSETQDVSSIGRCFLLIHNKLRTSYKWILKQSGINTVLERLNNTDNAEEVFLCIVDFYRADKTVGIELLKRVDIRKLKFLLDSPDNNVLLRLATVLLEPDLLAREKLLNIITLRLCECDASTNRPQIIAVDNRSRNHDSSLKCDSTHEL